MILAGKGFAFPKSDAPPVTAAPAGAPVATATP